MKRKEGAKDVNKIRVNTVIKLYTLVKLLEGPKYGYEIMKYLEERVGTKVGPSQIYPFLKMLADNGLLRVTAKGERDKRIYELTKEGREFAESILYRTLDLIQTSIRALGPERVCPPDYRPSD